MTSPQRTLEALPSPSLTARPVQTWMEIAFQTLSSGNATTRTRKVRPTLILMAHPSCTATGRHAIRRLPAAVATVSRIEVESSLQAQTVREKPWSAYGGHADSSRYFDSKNITKQNVQQLQVAWSYPFGDTVFHPIVIHGTIYGRGRSGSLVALDARTGKELWIREGMQAMTTRGVNYWESKDGKDRRLIFSMNDYLQEIDAVTGKVISTFGNDGVVDLREGLGRDPLSIGRVQSGTPGQVFENLILLGSAPGEGYML